MIRIELEHDTKSFPLHVILRNDGEPRAGHSITEHAGRTIAKAIESFAPHDHCELAGYILHECFRDVGRPLTAEENELFDRLSRWL